MTSHPQRERTYTPNQVVAYNLRRARLEKGWTQERAARELAPHLGVHWSAASYSLTERSAERSTRVRHFTAHELVAFSRTFGLPVLWFLLPPSLGPEGPPLCIAPAGVSAPEALSLGSYLEVLLGTTDGPAQLALRLEELRRERPGEMETSFFRLLDEISTVASHSAVRQVVGDLEARAQGLRDLALFLEEASETTARGMEAALKRLHDDCYGELLAQEEDS